MTKTTHILISILAISFLGMILFLNSWAGLSTGEFVLFLLFGVALVVISILVAKHSPNNSPNIPNSGFLRYYSIGLVIVFASWMLISIILLPFLGGVGFELIDNDYFGLFFAASGLVAAPIAKKYIN